MTNDTGQWSIRSRLIALGVIIAAAVTLVFIPVNTQLGEKVQPTGTQRGFELWDKSGRDLIGNIWWRAHKDMLDVNETALTAVLLVLFLAFIALAAVALWYALSIPAADDSAAE
jgi:predicted RND superfamily exporter protein